MVSKRCAVKDCDKVASWGYADGPAVFCAGHGRQVADMVCKDKLCEHPGGCTTQGTFILPRNDGVLRYFCAAHGKPLGAVSIYPTCIVCGKQATYGSEPRKPKRCQNCRRPGKDFNVKEWRELMAEEKRRRAEKRAAEGGQLADAPRRPPRGRRWAAQQQGEDGGPA